MYWDFWVRVPDQFAIYQGHLRPRSLHAELVLAAHLRAGSSELGPQQWLFLSLAPALALTTSQPLLPLPLEQRWGKRCPGRGRGTCLGASQELQLLFGNTNCSKFVVSGEKLHLAISMFFAL